MIRNQPVEAVTVPTPFYKTSEMTCIPKTYRYTKEHEWVWSEGDIGTIGITYHAQHELGDIVYVDLPKIGARSSRARASAPSNR